MKNPFKNFTKKEWILWIASLFIVVLSNLLTADFDLLTLLASLENPAYLPVVVNFAIFFFNDMYGFLSWKRREILLDL